ncbi:MAG: RNA polymerase sigma factor [Chloroflexota bacterium]
MDQEHEWVLLARGGDTEAFSRLVEAYQKPVYNLAYRMLGNSTEAEDAAQETFIRVYTRIHTYDPARKFSSWLLSIASHYCIDRLRRRRMTLLSLEDVAFTGHLASNEEQPEDAIARDQKETQVQRLLDTLPEDYRAAVVLRYWYDLSYSEIATMLETTESAIKSRLFRARQMMAQSARETMPGLIPQFAAAA